MLVDLLLTDDERALLEVVGKFARDRVKPSAAQADAVQQFPPSLFEELSLLGVFSGVPVEYGGDGGPSRAVQLLLAEVIAGADAGLAYEVLSSNAATTIVEAAGSAQQREEILGRFATTPQTSRNVLYFEGHGRSPLELVTSARKDESGWILSGEKRSVARPLGTDISLVFASVDGGVGAFVVDGPAGPGWRVSRDDRAVGKLGIRSAHTGDVVIEDLSLADGSLLGEVDSIELHRALAWYRLSLGAIALGVAASSLDYAVSYAKQRSAFGRLIIDYQGVEFPLVGADMSLDAARLNLQSTWSEIEQLTDREQIAWRTSYAYGVATAAALEATVIGVNTLGGHGYLADHPQERWYRDATTLSLIDFDPIIHTGSGV